MREGAIAAFHDYQASRGVGPDRPSAFDQSFRYGPLSVYVLDLRSERRADAHAVQVYSDAQHARLARFLDASHDQQVIVVGLSVPIVHAPDWLASAGLVALGEHSDVADRWCQPKARASRDRLLRLLRDHQRANPRQRMVMVGGDIHTGVVGRFEWGDATPPLYQLASSAVSNRQSPLLDALARGVPAGLSVRGGPHDPFARAVVLAPGEGMRNPYGGLNAGIVQVRPRGAESDVRLVLLGLDDDGAVVPVFDSGWLDGR